MIQYRLLNVAVPDDVNAAAGGGGAALLALQPLLPMILDRLLHLAGGGPVHDGAHALDEARDGGELGVHLLPARVGDPAGGLAARLSHPEDLRPHPLVRLHPLDAEPGQERGGLVDHLHASRDLPERADALHRVHQAGLLLVGAEDGARAAEEERHGAFGEHHLPAHVADAVDDLAAGGPQLHVAAADVHAGFPGGRHAAADGREGLVDLLPAARDALQHVAARRAVHVRRHRRRWVCRWRRGSRCRGGRRRRYVGRRDGGEG
ncbi:unnamed protein product [Linum tenue]|uniref:Uncharacterized protein n=1 Tax=Linum tenue TaxID=586396 RepID=A0AAV0S8F1_9ROSI|nr:unnamed protein product [Linum tenue]